MRANIANFVRHEIRVPKKNSLLPVFEAISNALDAINDGGQPGTVRISLFSATDLSSMAHLGYRATSLLTMMASVSPMQIWLRLMSCSPIEK